jgi:hypothetical protein
VIVRWLIIIVALRIIGLSCPLAAIKCSRGSSADLRLSDHGIGIAKIAAR